VAVLIGGPACVQVPLIACLTKFDGSTFQEMMNGDRRQYVVTQLPQYLIVHIKRFSKNTQQYVEKNPTIVNFPVRLRLRLDYPYPYP
jgi:U4/U6.U5 tri-snRNP-associated protein 2